jgi:coproporphyrinogen III oxidase-like Fe-S oxidoreductase
LKSVKEKWNEAEQEIVALSKKFICRQLMVENDDRLILTQKGKLFADGITADLFAPYLTKYKTV